MAKRRSENVGGRFARLTHQLGKRNRPPGPPSIPKALSGARCGRSDFQIGSSETHGPIFLCHRVSDGGDLTRELAWVLRAHGVPVWVDDDDFPPGDTDIRMEQALAGGISGAIIVVTPEISKSKAVQGIELVRILELAERHPNFILAIANTIRDPNEPSRPDYGAPDRLLREPTSERLAKITQYLTLLDASETLEHLAADIIRQRLRCIPLAADNTLVVDIESRQRGSAQIFGEAHVISRLEAPDPGRRPLPARSWRRLRPVLDLLPDLVSQCHAANVRIRGGAHLSVGFAIGAALPITAPAQVCIEDRDGDCWGIRSGSTPQINEDYGTTGEHGDPIAVYVNMTLRPEGNDAFDRFLAESSEKFSAWLRLTVCGPAKIAGVDGVATASALEQRIVFFAAEHRTHEIHLFLRVPFALAVLLGRRFNTLTVHLYEWEDSDQPSYKPAVIIASGRGGGPIAEVTAEE